MAVARRMTWQWLAEAVVGGKGGGDVDGGVDVGVLAVVVLVVLVCRGG